MSYQQSELFLPDYLVNFAKLLFKTDKKGALLINAKFYYSHINGKNLENYKKRQNHYQKLKIMVFGRSSEDFIYALYRFIDAEFQKELISFVEFRRQAGASVCEAIFEFCEKLQLSEEDIQSETLRKKFYRKAKPLLAS